MVLALSMLYFSYVFQLYGDAPFDSGLGDWIDPYFINYLLEHWYHSVLSLTDPSSPAMYFPVRGTLGYSHGLILYVPFYLAARPFFHPFQAYTFSLFLIMETGCLFLYAGLRTFLRLGFIEALLLTAFFVSSQNIVNAETGIWSQRASVFLIPVILYAALAARRMAAGRARLMLAWVSGLLATLLFVQDFYTAFFASLITILILAGGIVATHRQIRARLVAWWTTAMSILRHPEERAPLRPPSRWWLAAAGLSLAAAMAIELHPISRVHIAGVRVSADKPGRGLFIAALTAGWFVVRRFRPQIARVARSWRRLTHRMAVPSWWREDAPYAWAGLFGALMGAFLFFWIYLATHREHPGFTEDMLAHSFTVFDASEARGLTGVLRSLVVFDSGRSFELVFLVGALAWVPWLPVERRTRLYGLWFMFVSVLVLVIPFRFGDFSVWMTFFRPLPGGSVIRDPKRVIEVYELAVVLLAGLFLARLRGTSWFRRAVPLVVLLLLVTQWNREVFAYSRPNRAYEQAVEAPIAVDSSCQSFFIKGASPQYMSRSDNMWSLYAMDAMFIALNHSIPTLNGYSAWMPEHWELGNPQEPSYLERVARWIDAHNLRGVCELDIDARKMTPYHPIQPPR
jgi:hypothetical protein